MTIDILTLFPQMFSGPFSESIIKRAKEKGLVEIRVHNLRDWAKDKHKTVDDKPYGGGTGMILMCQPIFDAVEELVGSVPSAPPSDPPAGGERSTNSPKSAKGGRSTSSHTILLTPQGQLFNQKTAQRLSKLQHLILICGHYEGVDERVREHLVDEEISIGDYILTGGELPAMVVADTIVRLIPGVLEKPEAVKSESFSLITYHLSLEYPQYTRPEIFRGRRVPKILLSGNHQAIEKWRQEQALKRTQEKRPDLLKHSSSS